MTYIYNITFSHFQRLASENILLWVLAFILAYITSSFKLAPISRYDVENCLHLVLLGAQCDLCRDAVPMDLSDVFVVNAWA